MTNTLPHCYPLLMLLSVVLFFFSHQENLGVSYISDFKCYIPYSIETRPEADCGSDHELLTAKFRLKLNLIETQINTNVSIL